MRADWVIAVLLVLFFGIIVSLAVFEDRPSREEIEHQAVAEYLESQPAPAEHVTRIMVNRWVSVDHRDAWVRELEAIGKSRYHIVPCEATAHIPDGNPDDIAGVWINCFLLVDLGGSDATQSPSRPDLPSDG